MEELVSVKRIGGYEKTIIFRCQGVAAVKVNRDGIISGIPREVYDRDLKKDPRFELVSGKKRDDSEDNKKEQKRKNKNKGDK